MTPALFKAFRRKRGNVPLSAQELRRAGWTSSDINRASLNGYIRKIRVFDINTYDLISEPDWKAPPPPQPKSKMPETQAELAKAWKALCRAEGHYPALPEPYHKGVKGLSL